ncbi:MAG TPA: hemerythrin domain-containing protein [Bacillota bacterium]|nr:hemerythrin domain-containing protein [Bacillota bacterium]
MTTTGPALRELRSHRSIHEGAHAEAKELTEMIVRLLADKRMEDSQKVAKLLIEYWETRIIAHADAEDEGFYQELLRKKPQLKKDIYMLMRDHELFRLMIEQIKREFSQKEAVTESIIQQFQSLLVINHLHHQGEEDKLFH